GYWHDPEGWFQLRVIAIDTVGNSDSCDNVICQITVRLNDIEPAARVKVFEVYSVNDTLNRADSSLACTDPDIWYINADDPYCVRAIFAPTNIDTGLASLTFQYRSLYVEGNPSEWRNVETIWDPINYGLNGDTTRCVIFQPRPNEVGEHGFDLRVIVEDYNGNDTSAVVTLYIDDSPPVGTGTAAPSIAFTGPCGDRCRLDQNGNPLVTALFDPDLISGEVNVDSVWMTVARADFIWQIVEEDTILNGDTLIAGEDSMLVHAPQFTGGPWGLERDDDHTWLFDFDGNLCAFWLSNQLDMGCYYFTLHFTDCAGNEDSVAVTTTCGEGDETDLICIDCVPELPEFSSLDYMNYWGWDCSVDSACVSLRDNVLDGTTEIGGGCYESVQICGHIPNYQQYIGRVWLFVESEDAEVESTLVDTREWMNTGTSATDTTYCFWWSVGERDSNDVPIWPSGRYRVWVLATDAICQIQSGAMVDEFWVYVDNAAPIAEITQINGHAPNAMGPDTLELFSGGEDPSWLWVDWYDSLNPDDSTQAHNRVQLWAKNHLYPASGDTVWHQVGYIPSPCNPHFVLWDGYYTCGETIDLVAIAVDRWGNGEFTLAAVREAFNAGRYIYVVLTDRIAPATELWSIGFDSEPEDNDSTQVVNQQDAIVHLSSEFWNQDVYLHAFSTVSDPTIERVYFQYSMDGESWIDIAMDDDPEGVPDCRSWSEPIPWWCNEYEGEDIMWTALWDISGLAGHLWVRVWGQDICGNVEDFNVYEVTIDVAAPMAKVFAWLSDVNVGNLPCDQWTEPQIPDSLERYSTLTLGACPDSTGTVHYDAYGVEWWIKRADENPIDYGVWCELGDDSTGPFSLRPVNLWDGADLISCIEPQPGVWYDIAVRTTDQNGHYMPWEQMLWFAEGTTWQEKWQDLINRGYVKRFRVVDHTAPVAHSLSVSPDRTVPDWDVIFVTGNVLLSAVVDDPDVMALTFAVRQAGDTVNPWTVIERIEGDSGTTFAPAEGYWNTELLNGTYIIGAFAEDEIGNRDGNLLVPDQWPTYTVTVNVDNQRPNAFITSVTRDGQPVSQLERGAGVTFHIEATDNFHDPASHHFGIRNVVLYVRMLGDNPASWIPIDTVYTWPYTVQWTVPPQLVLWNYEFAAVATDLVLLRDMVDGQGHYLVDGTYDVVDNEANISIFTIGGRDAETTPHIHGTNVEIVAHSEPNLDNVRFVWVRGDDTTYIGAVSDTIGETVWTLTGWDVSGLAEGPAQVGAIGSADVGGDRVTLSQDFRNIVIDHTIGTGYSNPMPMSHGLVGGSCEFDNYPTDDDLWIILEDTTIDTVWFDWKWAANPNDETFWMPIARGILDDGLTRRWSFQWDATEVPCGLITLRARVNDDAVPESNVAKIIFADSVRVDNCDPLVNITNINGDVTPEDAEIARGEVATIVATVIDDFAQGGNSAIDSVAFYYSYGLPITTQNWTYIGSDANGAPWQTMWNTSSEWYGEFTIRAIAWDEAGNCAYDDNVVNIVDRLSHRAYIVGWDFDAEDGCDDYIWAITDDCTPDLTDHVLFEYTVDGGQTWISLGTDNHGDYSGCDFGTYYRLWSMQLEFASIPQNAVFRAVAFDDANNFDQNPPRFRWSDVTLSPDPVIYNPEAARIPAHPSGKQPFV
ncbi:hypothetical protein KJ815_04040, partial [bacterium]|nr:hypothetical protein [bacterium]